MIRSAYGQRGTVPLSGSSKLTRPSCASLRASAPMNAFVMLAIANVVRAVTRAAGPADGHARAARPSALARDHQGRSSTRKLVELPLLIEHALQLARQLRRHLPIPPRHVRRRALRCSATSRHGQDHAQTPPENTSAQHDTRLRKRHMPMQAAQRATGPRTSMASGSRQTAACNRRYRIEARLSHKSEPAARPKWPNDTERYKGFRDSERGKSVAAKRTCRPSLRLMRQPQAHAVVRRCPPRTIAMDCDERGPPRWHAQRVIEERARGGPPSCCTLDWI